MAEKHCKLCVNCIHHGTCWREGNKKAYNGDLDISRCDYFKDKSRFIELPCKVGDTVYEIAKECLGCLHYSDGGYSDYCECTLDENKLMFECDFDKECVHKIIPKKFMYGMIEHFGKTVFLTREEAEKALFERMGVCNG